MQKAEGETTPSPDLQPQFVWLIERHFHSVLHYWTGRPALTERGSANLGVWTTNIKEAMRFSRRGDAEVMLTWHCEGIGNVVQHGFDR